MVYAVAHTGDRFKRGELLIKLKDHGYYEGEQHISKQPTRLSTCDTAVFIWQTTAAASARPADKAVRTHQPTHPLF